MQHEYNKIEDIQWSRLQMINNFTLKMLPRVVK